MRIKQYDYDTAVKLKNPLRNYDAVLDFVLNYFEKTTVNNFLFDSEEIGVKQYICGDIYCFHEEDEDCISFFTSQSAGNINCFYFLSQTTINKPKDIESQDAFEDLKRLFLMFKLQEKLDTELKNATINKRVINKI